MVRNQKYICAFKYYGIDWSDGNDSDWRDGIFDRLLIIFDRLLIK